MFGVFFNYTIVVLFVDVCILHLPNVYVFELRYCAVFVNKQKIREHHHRRITMRKVCVTCGYIVWPIQNKVYQPRLKQQV